MEKCWACDKPTANPVKGYLAPGSILCPECHDYLDNEVFVAEFVPPEEAQEV